jgi:hypothetical protein
MWRARTLSFPIGEGAHKRRRARAINQRGTPVLDAESRKASDDARPLRGRLAPRGSRSTLRGSLHASRPGVRQPLGAGRSDASTERPPATFHRTGAPFDEPLRATVFQSRGDGHCVGCSFDAIDHGWMMKFFEHRIADRRMLRLLQKWLSAGVLQDGKWTASEEGTPQGATVSPLAANVYLHYVLDLWVQQWRSRRAHGDVIVVRFADDCAPRRRRREAVMAN